MHNIYHKHCLTNLELFIDIILCVGPEGGETDVCDVAAGQAADGSGEEAETIQGKLSLTFSIYFIFRNKQVIGSKAETIQG